MPIEISLSPLQIKQIASSIDLKDVKEYAENHKEEYEQFLLEEEKKQNKVNRTTQFKKFTFLKETKDSLVIRNKLNTTFCIIWQEYKQENGKLEG